MLKNEIKKLLEWKKIAIKRIKIKFDIKKVKGDEMVKKNQFKKLSQIKQILIKKMRIKFKR